MKVVDDFVMQFEAPKWFVCDHALRVTNPENPLREAPETEGDWPALGSGADARKAREEVLETLLVLNLRQLLRERVQFLFRGGDYWGIQDITGVDNLGRLHLFELKRDSVRGVVPEQLGMYLLGGLFQAGDALVDELWSMNVARLPPKRWGLYIAAAQANSRTSNVGRHDVNEWHPSVRSGATKAFGEARWHHLIEGGETEAWLTTAMLEKAKSRGAPHVSGSDVATWAATTYSELTATRPAIPRVRPRSRAVIWLVGRSFDPAVFRQVRLWRRAGLDARCLILDARQSKRTGRWIICVQREFFPQRDEALESLAANQAAIEGSPEAVRLDLEFYDARPPSDDEIERGGLPLDDETRVVVRGWNDETKVLYRAKGRGA